MKPLYLEFCGINSFSEKAQIDFRALLSGGVFGIFGDTGSGKSTILDSIHFALYGEIDRAPKAFSDCINYRADGAYVIFDFEITTEGVRRAYRVKRERKRKAGSTKAYLYEYTAEGKLLALAEGARDVDERVEQIIGLNFQDFKTCIALPQGDFAALVKAPTSERVKLVSRLFSLEKYGERLSKAINEKYYKADEQVNLLKAQMGENEGGRYENIAQIDEQINESKRQVSSLNETLGALEKEEKAQTRLKEEKEEYKRLKKRLDELQTNFSQMQEKMSLIEKLPFANAVKEKADALEKSREDAQAAKEKSAFYAKETERLNAEATRCKIFLQEGNFEEKIVKLTLEEQKLSEAETDRQAAQQAKKELDDCKKAYRELENKCPKEKFEEQRAKLEEELARLGEDESLFEYLKRRFSSDLIAGAREEFRADLSALAEKHPQIEGDILPLLKKYENTTTSGERFEIETAQLAFKQTEKRRKELKKALEDLQKRLIAFQQNEGEKELLKAQGKLLRQNFERAAEKIENLQNLGTLEEAQKRLSDMKAEQERAKKALETAQNAANEASANAQQWESLKALHEKSVKERETLLNLELSKNNFAGVSEAKELILKVGDSETAKRECKTFFDEYVALSHKYESVDERKFANYSDEALQRIQGEKSAVQTRLSDENRNLGALEKEKESLLEKKRKYETFEKELQAKDKYKTLCDELRTMVKSNKFLEFIASEYLQEICATASKTLLSLTGGRYFLRYNQEFKVGDNFDGGSLRAVRTLSGGETFLVSLSLALSLSAAICLKSLRPIEFFFLDEGFGTLDEKLVDTVMDVLGKLGKSFAVGLISHVEELKRRIENKIVVTGANESHGSLVRVESYS